MQRFVGVARGANKQGEGGQNDQWPKRQRLCCPREYLCRERLHLGPNPLPGPSVNAFSFGTFILRRRAPGKKRALSFLPLFSHCPPTPRGRGGSLTDTDSPGGPRKGVDGGTRWGPQRKGCEVPICPHSPIVDDEDRSTTTQHAQVHELVSGCRPPP